MPRHRLTSRPGVPLVVVTGALVLTLSACSDDSTRDGDSTPTAPATTPAEPSPTTTPEPSTTEAPSEDADPAAVDPGWQRYEEAWLVTGVEPGDTLNVRLGPGVEHPVIHELPPDADDVTLFDAVEEVDGGRWGPVEVPGGAGWVNLAFLNPAGSNPPVVQGFVDPRAETAADDVQAALGIPDLGRLASFVDERGVLVSHDAFVDDTDPVLSAEQLIGAPSDDAVLLWGYTDGVGEPIRMTIGERLDEIARDYALASTDVIGFNTRVGMGNTLDNVAERFPGASVVEYHFDGTSLYGDFDWSSVRFVFDTTGTGRPVLLAVLQDTWTI